MYFSSVCVWVCFKFHHHFNIKWKNLLNRKIIFLTKAKKKRSGDQKKQWTKKCKRNFPQCLRKNFLRKKKIFFFHFTQQRNVNDKWWWRQRNKHQKKIVKTDIEISFFFRFCLFFSSIHNDPVTQWKTFNNNNEIFFSRIRVARINPITVKWLKKNKKEEFNSIQFFDDDVVELT